MNADTVFWSQFLKLYKSLPVLWDVKNENYCNRVEKDAAYELLVNKLQEIDPTGSMEKVKRKIHIFRTNYRRELKKIKKHKGLKPTLWYFHLLHFLEHQWVPSQPKSSISDDESVSDRSTEVFESPVEQKNVKEVEIVNKACETLKQSNDDVMTKVWATQYADNVFWSEFLDMYKSLPVLWAVKNENYGDRAEKMAAYNQLVDKLKEIDPEANTVKVRRKIHIFRTNYRRELKKIESFKQCGANDVYQSTLWYFDLLHFLTDQVKQTKAKNDLSDDDSLSDRGNEVFDENENKKMACELVKESNNAVTKTRASKFKDRLFWSEFLEMYKSLPVLWQMNSYITREEKEEAYETLVDKLKEIDPEANSQKVKKKIYIFRSNYNRELRRVQKSIPGPDGVYHSNLWYFDLLHFLTEHEEQSKTNSNMGDDDSESDGGNEVYDEEEITRMACEILKESNDAVETKAMASEYADNVFWSEFLEIYKSLPVLWKDDSENYFTREEREAAYEELVDKLKEIDPEASTRKVKREIHVFRSNYNRELKRIEKSSPGVYQSSLWYFDLLHFLTDQEEEPSKANIIMGDDYSMSDRDNEEFEEDEINEMSFENLNSDAISVLADGWAAQYAELENEQRVLARIIWADVLFHGCINRLTEKMVEDIHHILKDTSNTSTPTPTSAPTPTSTPRPTSTSRPTSTPTPASTPSPTSVRSLTPMPYDEEYSYSPQPQFTFVAFEQSDKPQVSHTNKRKQSGVVRQIPSTDLPSTSTSRILHPPTNKEVINRSSLTQRNVKEYSVSLANDNDNENALNNSDEFDDTIEDGAYEDMLYEVDDDNDDMMGLIDQVDDSRDEINKKNLFHKPEENPKPNAAEVAVSILNDTREDKFKYHPRRINWQKLSDDECRELRRLQRKRDCICDQCGRHFADASNLKLHILRHTGIKNFECKDCNAKFYTAHLLKRHSVMHKDSPEMYSCEHCEKKFFSNEIRLQHERSHFKERPFHCDHCDKSFFSKPQLKEHEVVHTRVRNYNCELCNQNFMRGQHLRRHYGSKIHKLREQQLK